MPQISRGKFDRLRCTTAGSTTSALDGYGLRRHSPLRPPPLASYPVLVHRLASLLHASFRPRLAASVISPLRFAITSRPSRCEEDFHLQAVEPARHTNKKGRCQASGLGVGRLQPGNQETLNLYFFSPIDSNSTSKISVSPGPMSGLGGWSP